MSPTKFATQGASLRMEGRLGRYDTLGLSVFAIQKQWPGSWLHPSRDYENWSDREIGILRWNHTCPFVLADEMELRLGIVRNDRVRWRKDSYSRDGIYVLTPQADLILHKRLGCHTLTYGLHAHQDRIEAPLATTQGSIKEIPDGYLLTEGIYVQDEWQVTRRLRVTGGLRFDLSQVETNPEAATTDPLIDPSEIDLSRDDSAWTGKLAVYYRLTDAVGLTTNLARGYRFPGPNDLASFRQAPDEIQVGNPDLNPEYSTVWDAGVHFNRPKWRGSVGGFVAWFDDLIIGRSGTWNGMTYLDRNMNGMQDPDEDFFIRENAGSATFYGVEASAEWEFWPCFTAFGNFTWWHGDISPAPTEPIGVPTNGTLGVRYGNVGDFFWAELACHMVARFDDIPPDFYNDEAFFFKDPQDSSSGPYRNDHSMPGYSIFDLRGGVKVSKHLSLTFGVENLFDKKYRSFGSRRFGNGATVYVGAKADL